MKRLMIGTLVAALALGAVGVAPKAEAGDREWAVAGKILAGFMVLNAVTTPRCAPVAYRPAVYAPPVAYRPAPVFRPVAVARPHVPPPRVIFREGYRQGYTDGRRDGFRIGRRVGFQRGARQGYSTGVRHGFHTAVRQGGWAVPRRGIYTGLHHTSTGRRRSW